MPIQETLQGNKQHAVPQNIMDVEFKLIGDLTMRQFVYLLIFSGIAYGAYILNVPVLLKWPLILVSVVAGLGFAFLPVEDRGLDEWIVYFFQAVYNETQMVWRKEPKPPSAFLYENLSMVQQELITLAPTSSRRKLEQYLQAEKGDKEKDAYDQLEASYVLKVQEAFATVSPETSVILEEPEGLEMPEFMMEPEEEEFVTEESMPTEEVTEEVTPTVPTITEGTLEKPETVPSAPTPKVITEKKREVAKPKPKPKPRPRPAVRLPSAAEDIIVTPLTPDMHAGRKFTSMLPSQGTIVLPIRGEKVLKTTSETQIDQDAAKKADQLKAFMSQIKTSTKPEDLPYSRPGVPEQTSEKEIISEEAQRLIDQLQQENTQLSTEIQNLKTGLEAGTPQEQENKKIKISQLEKEMSEKTTTIVKLKEQIKSLKPEESLDPELPEAMSSKLGQIPEHLQPKTPNTLAGVIRNIQARGLKNVTMLVKNAKGDPIRALKTNELGEFSLTNPLPNGSYKVEVDVNNVTGLTFDIINFDAKGEIIPAMEFVGK